MSTVPCHPVRLLGDVTPETRVRRPDPSVPLEAPLVAGSTSARAASRQVVQSLLPGVDLDALEVRGDDAPVVHATPGLEAVGARIGPDVLDEVLALHDWGPPRLRPMRDGQDLPYGAFAAPAGSRPGRSVRAQVGRLVAELTGGATVAIDGVDEAHGALEALAEDLERFFAARVLINAYVSGGDTSATQRHWDDHDVIVLQLEGAKHWEIRRPAAPAPLRGVVGDRSEGDAVCWEGTLAPGDSLFVPRGHPHVVTPTGGFSLHLTAGITRVRAVDVLTWLQARAPGVAELRRDLHPAVDDDDVELERRITEDLVTGAVGRYRLLSAVRQPARASTRFSAMRKLLFTEDRTDLTARLALPGGLLVEDTQEAGDLVLVGAGRRWAVVDHALELVGRLLAGDPLALDELEVDCPSGPSCARTLVAQLAVDGVVAIDRAHGPLAAPSVS